MKEPTGYVLVERDDHDFSLGEHIYFAIDSAITLYPTFWNSLMVRAIQPTEAERERYLSELVECSLEDVRIESGLNDSHFPNVPGGTWFGVAYAFLGALRDPVSAFEMYEGNGFREDNTYYEQLQDFYRRPEQPRSFADWVVDRAYNEGFAPGLRRMKLGLNPLPDWWEDRYAQMGVRDFWGRL